MKRIAALAVAIALATTTTPRAAGIFGSYLDGGSLGAGYGVGVLRRIPVIPLVSVEVRGSWVHFSDLPVSLDMFPLEVMGKVSLSSVYGALGVGYYLLSAGSGSADNKTGGFAALGMEFSPTRLGLFAEGRYLLLDTHAAFGHIDADGFGVNAGLLLNW